MNKQIIIVIAVIRNDAGELLMSRRIDPDFPEAHNTWEFVGGKIEFNETPENAVLREVKEETGLDVEILRLLPKIETNVWDKQDGDKVQVFILSYECRITGGKLYTPEKYDSKIAELRFVKLEEVKNYQLMKAVPEIISDLNLKS